MGILDYEERRGVRRNGSELEPREIGEIVPGNIGADQASREIRCAERVGVVYVLRGGARHLRPHHRRGRAFARGLPGATPAEEDERALVR